MRTHVGVVRKRNEDSAYVDPDRCVFIVADGMGGHAAGDVASALAVKVVRDALEEDETLLESYGDDAASEGTTRVQMVLERAVRAANDAVLEEGRGVRKRSHMGTTLDVVMILGDEAFVAHAGDSRTYLMREGKARQLTRDHTVAQTMVDAGALAPEDLVTSPMRSVLSNAVGCEPGVEVEHVHVTLRPGDRLLLCTDGLYEYFQEDELAERVTANAGNAALEGLIDEACERGGHDNVTGVIIEMPVPEAGPVDELEDAPTTPICVPFEARNCGPLAGISDSTLTEIVDQVLRETSRPFRLPEA